jgi:hypothetical protein
MTSRSYYRPQPSAALKGRHQTHVAAGLQPRDNRTTPLGRIGMRPYKSPLMSDSYWALPTMPEFLRQMRPSRAMR